MWKGVKVCNFTQQSLALERDKQTEPLFQKRRGNLVSDQSLVLCVSVRQLWIKLYRDMRSLRRTSPFTSQPKVYCSITNDRTVFLFKSICEGSTRVNDDAGFLETLPNSAGTMQICLPFLGFLFFVVLSSFI